MKINNRVVARIGTGALLLFACFYMYDFYKCLSGFIANGFRESGVMLPMILGFFLPVLCFFVFVYDFYVRELRPATRVAYSVFIAVYAALDLTFIFSNFELYASNNAHGVYDSLPSIILRFPYDITVILVAVIVLQILKFRSAFIKPSKLAAAIGEVKQRGSLHLGCAEFVGLCVPGVFALVFTGAAVSATFNAFDNVFYNWRYVFLLVWVMLIPLGNILLLALKPERMNVKRGTKLTVLGTAIAMNLVFAGLFVLCELTYPDFIVHMGKPMFLIAFSVSLPIEQIIIFIIMALGTALMTASLIRTARAPK